MFVFYENKKGNSIKVFVTPHFLKRFKERYERVNGKKITFEETKCLLGETWNSGNLLKEKENFHLIKTKKKIKKR